MTRRILSIETVAAGAPSNPAPVERALAQKLASSNAAATSADARPASGPSKDVAGEPMDAGLKVSKGIAIGMLLAVPFWVALVVWLVW